MNDLIDPMQRAEIQQAFGTRVKELRKQKGWTQKELAARVDVRTAQLNKYEGGLHSPPFETLLQLADALGTSVDYLLSGDEADFTGPLHNTRLLDRFRELQSLGREDQETVIRLVDALIVQRRVEGLVEVRR